MSTVAACNRIEPVAAAWRWLRTTRYALSGLLLAVLSARAAAPPPSQEFWHYLVEFSDTQGDLFDPADYAAVADMPAKARAEFERAERNRPATETEPANEPKHLTETTPATISHATEVQTGQEQAQ